MGTVKKISFGLLTGICTFSMTFSSVTFAYAPDTLGVLTKSQAITALIQGYYPDYTSLDDILSQRVAPIKDLDILLGNSLNNDTPLSNPEENTDHITTTYRSSNLDTQTIQDERLGRINYERSTQGLPALVLDESLNTTSIERANYLADNKQYTNMHRRPNQICKTAYCYDLDNRFHDRGMAVASETVLYGGYKCGLQDCTQNFIETIRGRIGGPSGFLGFILGEKSYNGVHYKMMMTPSYTKIGIGFSNSTHPGFGSSYIGVLHYQ